MALSAFRGVLCAEILKSPRKLRGLSLAKSPQTAGCRLLYTPAVLGIESFESTRKRTLVQFTHNVEAFKEKMNTCLTTLEKGLVFTEDLKNTIYLTEAEEKDVELVLAMAKKFNQQNAGLRFGAFNFGPLVMRLFFFLNQPQAALKALEAEELEGFFDQMVSYQIAMTLLYNNEQYEDALKVFDLVQERRIGGVRYPKTCFTLALACCYKMNTPESFATAQQLLDSATEYGLVVNRRLICMAAALCLCQGRPQDALTALADARTTTHIAIVSLKVKALSEMDRGNEILPILRSFTQEDLPSTPKWKTNHRILQEAVVSAEEAVARSENKEVRVEFERIVKSLREHDMISDKTIDGVVTEPIEPSQLREKGPRNRERERLAASFYPRNRRTPYYPPAQPQHAPRRGLLDME